MDNINKQLFGNDNYAYLGPIIPALVFNYGTQFKEFSYGIGVGIGGDENETDEHASKMIFTRFNFHLGYHSNEDKRVSFYSQIALGASFFELTGTSFNNAITFDSLLSQAKTSGTVTRSINLVSNYNGYIEPEIGIVFHTKRNPFKRALGSIGINIGYMYYGSVDWRTTGGQKISNFPLTITGIPDCSITFRFQGAYRQVRNG